MQGRPSEIIASLRSENADLRSLVDTLKAALYAYGMDYEDLRPNWAADLTAQQQSLMTMLMAAYPRPVNHFRLLEGLPGRDHCEDRDVKLIAVLVCRCRKVFGKNAITNVHGIGYALSKEQYALMTGDAKVAPVIKARELLAA